MGNSQIISNGVNRLHRYLIFQKNRKSDKSKDFCNITMKLIKPQNQISVKTEI